MFNFQERVLALKREIQTLCLAARDPRTPWYAKVFVDSVIAYALSPIDLIPDPIPILGYLDDMLLIPLGVYLAIRTVPKELLAECREKVEMHNAALPKNWVAGGIILTLWIGAGLLLLNYFWRRLF